jgi:hypothetical protein
VTSLPFFSVAVAVGTLMAIWLMTRSSIGEYISNASDLSGRIQKADAKRTTRSWSIDSPQGHIEIVDIRDGTEFTRVIAMPNGKRTFLSKPKTSIYHEEEDRTSWMIDNGVGHLLSLGSHIENLSYGQGVRDYRCLIRCFRLALAS